jgi:hypothetical protein
MNAARVTYCHDLMRRTLPVVALVIFAAGAWWFWSSAAPEEPATQPSVQADARAPGNRGASTEPRAKMPTSFDDDPTPTRLAAIDPNDGGLPDAGSSALSEEMRKAAETIERAQVEKWLADNAETATKRVDEYCEQTKKLSAVPDERKRDRDAALFMAGRTDWEDGHVGLLRLPDALYQQLKNPPAGAWRHLGPQVYAGLDFSWMQALLQFDHWSIAVASPLRDVAEVKSYADAPIPNFVTLQAWVKLRLLKGLHEGDLASASVEVRHLAELCGSTGSLVGDMIRIQMFNVERGFVEEHHLSLQPALTFQQGQRLRYADFAARDFLLPGVPKEVRSRALECAPVKCTAIMEALGATSMVSDVAAGAQEHLKWLLAQSPCDPALAAMTAKFRPLPPTEILGAMMVRTLDENLDLLKNPPPPE